ncbi:uncharacterized protein LOC120422919 [Culex pipiens pallens]|uniref:uncharacterized protein LOC120422919 n=1 Tax=Culex pipiens pallens TaxID=42434 RepID=UPI001954AE49|nr:uncharacterized protein LOC120422919 [Culex pipiens pallens]
MALAGFGVDGKRWSPRARWHRRYQRCSGSFFHPTTKPKTVPEVSPEEEAVVEGRQHKRDIVHLRRRARSRLGNPEARRFRVEQPSERVRREPQIRQGQELSERDAERAKVKTELQFGWKLLVHGIKSWRTSWLEKKDDLHPISVCQSRQSVSQTHRDKSSFSADLPGRRSKGLSGSPGLKSMDPSGAPGLVTTRPSGPSGQKPQNDDTEDHEVTVGGTSVNFHKNQAARISPLGRPEPASKQRMHQDQERSGKETGSREASSTSPFKLACNAGKEAGDRTRSPSHGLGT